MLRTTREWMAEPQAVVSGTLVDVDDPLLGRTLVPGVAVRSSCCPATPVPVRAAPGSEKLFGNFLLVEGSIGV